MGIGCCAEREGVVVLGQGHAASCWARSQMSRRAWANLRVVKAADRLMLMPAKQPTLPTPPRRAEQYTTHLYLTTVLSVHCGAESTITMSNA